MGCCVSTNTNLVVSNSANMDRPLSPKTEAVIARLKQVQLCNEEGTEVMDSPNSSPPLSPRMHMKPTTAEVVFGEEKRTKREPDAFKSWTELLLQAEGQRKHLSPDLQKDLLNGMALGRIAPLHLWRKAVKGNTVRVFFSGSPEDTEREQDIFHEDCVPFLRSVAHVVGLEYESHDLRLGYNFEDRSHHRVIPERHQEIERCLRSTSGLAFVGLLGDKYGFRPFPTSIDAGLFHRMVALLATPRPAPSASISRAGSGVDAVKAAEPRADQDTLETWFQLDCNCNPQMYRLAPVHEKLPGFDGRAGRRSQHAAEEQYKKHAFLPIQRTLRDIAEAGMAEGSLTRPEAEPFIRSSAAAEVARGIVRQSELDGGHAKHGAMFLRSFKGLAYRLAETGAGVYTDVLKNKNRDEEAEGLLKALRQSLARCIKPDKLVTLSLPWREGGIHPERYPEHRTYLKAFSDKCVEVQVLGMAEGVRERPIVGELVAELAEHLLLAEDSVQCGVGRQNLLTAIRVFLAGQSKRTARGQALALVGPEGSGKGTLLAAAVQRHMRNTDPVLHGKPMEMLSRLPSMRTLRGADNFKSFKVEQTPPLIPEEEGGSAVEPVLVLRVVGGTRFSHSSAQLLASITRQLAEVYGTPPAAVDPTFDPAHGTPFIPETFQALVDAFPLWLALPSRRRPLILVLIGLHRLQDDASCLSWLPLNPPPNVTVLLSASLPHSGQNNSPALAHIHASLAEVSILKVGGLLSEDITEIKRAWLQWQQRALTSEQSSALDTALEAASKTGCVTPLLVVLLLELTRKWTSSTSGKVLHSDMATSEEAAVHALLTLAQSHQPPGLVSHLVGGLAAAGGGLSVMELVDLANASSELLRSVLKHANPPLTRPAQAVVPAARVLRLLDDLGPLLTERVVDGGRRVVQFRVPTFRRLAAQYAARIEDGGWKGAGTPTEAVADMMCGIVREAPRLLEPEGHRLVEQLLTAISMKRKPVLFSQDGLVAAWTERGEMLRVNERRLAEAPPLLMALGRTRELHDMIIAPAAIWHLCRGLRRFEYARYWRHLEREVARKQLVEECCAGIQEVAGKSGCAGQATHIALLLSDFLLCHLNHPRSAGRVAQLALSVGASSGIEVVSSCVLAAARCLLAENNLTEALAVLRDGVRAWKEVGFTLPPRLLSDVLFRKAAGSPLHRRSVPALAKQGSNLGLYAEELKRMQEKDEGADGGMSKLSLAPTVIPVDATETIEPLMPCSESPRKTDERGEHSEDQAQQADQTEAGTVSGEHRRDPITDQEHDVRAAAAQADNANTDVGDDGVQSGRTESGEPSCAQVVGAHAPTKLLEPAAGMAEVLGRMGRWEECEEVYSQVATLAESGVGNEEGSLTAAVLHLSLARVRRTMGKMAGAVRAAEMARLHLDQSLADGHLSRRAMIAEMAAMEGAAGAVEGELALLASVSGGEGPWLGGVKEKVAEALVATGRWVEARAAMEEASKGYESALGGEHVLMATSGMATGAVRRGMGDSQGALHEWERVGALLRGWRVGEGETEERECVFGLVLQSMACGVRVCMVAWEQRERERHLKTGLKEDSSGWEGAQGRGLLAVNAEGVLGWGMGLGYRCMPVGAGSSQGIGARATKCLLLALLQTMVAEVYAEQGQHAQAYDRVVEASKTIERELGSRDLELVAAKGRVAETLQLQGKASEALAVLETVRDIAVKGARTASLAPETASGTERRWWEAKEAGSESGWEAWVRARWLERMGDLQLQLGDGAAAIESYERWQERTDSTQTARK